MDSGDSPTRRKTSVPTGTAIVKSGPLFPDLSRGAPGFSGLGRKAAAKAKLDERRQLGSRFEVDVAAVAAVAPGRPTLRHVFLSAPRDDAVTAVAGGDVDLDFVNKLHDRYFAG